MKIGEVAQNAPKSQKWTMKKGRIGKIKIFVDFFQLSKFYSEFHEDSEYRNIFVQTSIFPFRSTSGNEKMV